MMAIGTSRGFVLIFDAEQFLQNKLSLPEDGNMIFIPSDIYILSVVVRGRVTSVAFSSNCGYVACGLSTGFIILWDLSSGNVLKVIRPSAANSFRVSGHLDTAAVLHLSFIPGKRTDLVSADDLVR